MKYLIFVTLFFLLFSCSTKNEALELALQQAGTNRPELEKVLAHYQNDSLKYQAAVFLIKNMPYYEYQVSPEIDSIKISEDTLANSDLTLKGNYCIIENDSSTDLKFIPENTEFSILAVGKQEDVTPTIPTMILIDKEHKLFYIIILKNQWDAEEFEYTINKDDLKNIEARHMATGNYDEKDLSSIENLKNDIHFVEEEK